MLDTQTEPFARSRLRFRGNIQPSIARSRWELEDAFRLLYEAYTEAGLENPNAARMRLTLHHLIPSTEVMLVRVNGLATATASLILDGPVGLPAEEMYGNEIDRLRREGARICEIGCLADSVGYHAGFLRVFEPLSMLLAQAAAYRECDVLIAATHPRHAKFYMRHLGFEPFGEVRECPYVRGNPAIPLLCDLEKQRGKPHHERVFGCPFGDAELAPYEWDGATRQFFQSVFERQHMPPIPVETPLPAPRRTESARDRLISEASPVVFAL